MGSSKKAQYQAYQLKYALTAKALGHAARIAIVEYLSQNYAATNNDLRKLVKLNGATVYQHFDVLMEAGIIQEDFFFDKHYYYMNHQAKLQFIDVLNVFQS